MNIIRVSNRLDPGQGPDLGPRSLQMLSADDKNRQAGNP